jgi:hypothetical protein
MRNRGPTTNVVSLQASQNLVGHKMIIRQLSCGENALRPELFASVAVGPVAALATMSRPNSPRVRHGLNLSPDIFKLAGLLHHGPIGPSPGPTLSADLKEKFPQLDWQLG